MGSVSAPSDMARRLEGKVALVTGAARGIGECIAKLFCKHGAKVVIADIADNMGESVSRSLGGPPTSIFVHCDVTCESDVQNAVDTCLNNYGRLDVVVNNAAIVESGQKSILDNDAGDFERVIGVNLTGVFLGTKHAARAMIPTRYGSIINVGSVASSVGGVASHAYTSSKHGVIGLTRNVAAELGPYGIRVNCLSPYFIMSPLAETLFRIEEKEKFKVYSNLDGVTLKAEDVAEAALFLAADESKFVSGHNLAIDGGFTTINPAFGLFARV